MSRPNSFMPKRPTHTSGFPRYRLQARSTYYASGLLREVAIESAKTYFDTNTSNHYHFYFEEEARLMDIESSELKIEGLPPLPDGRCIHRIDIIVRLCRSVR